MRTNRSSGSRRSALPVIRPAIYALKGGVIYAHRSLPRREIMRRAATIVVTTSGKPFEIGLGKKTRKYIAVAIKPLVKHRLRADSTELLSVLVAPDHPHYPAFRSIAGDGLMAVEQGRFEPLAADIGAAYRGALSLKEAQKLFDSIIAATLEQLPEAKPLDPRMNKVIRLLRRDPNHALEDIADSVGISYHRMSHLFADSMGLPLRSYRLWQKEANVAVLLENGYTLKRAAHEAGFRDAMHLCRVFRQAYGAPPSYIYRNDATQYFSVNQPGKPTSKPKAPGKKN